MISILSGFKAIHTDMIHVDEINTNLIYSDAIYFAIFFCWDEMNLSNHFLHRHFGIHLRDGFFAVHREDEIFHGAGGLPHHAFVSARCNVVFVTGFGHKNLEDEMRFWFNSQLNNPFSFDCKKCLTFALNKITLIINSGRPNN
jgi:hypothetical protein